MSLAFTRIAITLSLATFFACGGEELDLDEQISAASGSGSGGGGGGGGGGNPQPSTPVLASITFSPSTLAGGSPATGTITFATVTDGAVVSLVSSNPAIVSVPSTMVVAGQQSVGHFPLTTSAVTAPATVTVTATAFGVTRTGTLQVNVATAPPTPDVVAIQVARYVRRSPRGGVIEIEATSTNSSAILTVEFPAGGALFTLTNQGGGRYSGSRAWNNNPGNIVVRSNFGGSAPASL